jgi:REJ domain
MSVINLTQQMNISVNITPIVVNLGGSNLSRPVLFEEDLIMNVSTSYDPDFSVSGLNSSVLSYQYQCGTGKCLINPAQMQGGVLRIRTVDKIMMNLPYMTNVSFSIIITNPLVPLKPA